MKPKILQVVLDMQYVGEKVVAALSKAVSDEFEVMFCCLDKIGLLGEELKREGFDVTVLNRKAGLDRSLPFKIASLAKEKQIDIIQAHHYTPYFYSALSRFIYHRPRLIFTEHGRDFPDIVKTSRKLSNLILNLVTDSITSVCDFSKKSLAQNEKLPTHKITVIYNGIEPIGKKAFCPDESNKEVLEWIGASDKVLGFLARLEWIKNPELLINAFAKTCGKIPDAKLVIMGKGELMPSLKKLCTDLKIEQNVFFAGLVKNPMPVIPKMCALVVTSLCEAASLSILETMMCGVPVLATDVGGNPELVADGQTGYLVESGSVNGFAEAMIKILSDKTLTKNLGKNAKACAMEKFSFDAMIKYYKAIYSMLEK